MSFLLWCGGIYLFGGLRRFQHCTGHIMHGSWKGRGNQYIQFVRVLYCKLPTNGRQLPAFPFEAVPGIEPRPQRWEARVLPLWHWCGGKHCVSFTGGGYLIKYYCPVFSESILMTCKCEKFPSLFSHNSSKVSLERYNIVQPLAASGRSQ